MKRELPKWTPNRNRRILYFYLGQLLIPAIYLVYVPLPKILVGLALIIAFGISYTYAFLPGRYRRYVGITLMMLILWLLSWWISPGYLAMIYYPAAVLSFMPRSPLIWGYVLLLGGTGLETALLLHRANTTIMDFLPTIGGVVFGVLSMTFMLRYYGKLSQTNQQLAHANAEIERLTKLQERQRISRDLHDVMGHQLSLITLKAQVAAKLISRGGQPQAAHAEILDIEHAARVALNQVREYVAGMRRPDFAEEWAAAQELLKAAGIEPTMTDTLADLGASAHMPDAVSEVLAMCLREAITNIVRHSHAERVFVKRSRDVAGSTFLLIADDGQGVIARARPFMEVAGDAGYTGSGLRGMRARVAAIGGSLTFWSHGDEPEDWFRSIPWRPGVAVCVTTPAASGSNAPAVSCEGVVE
ncbi:sensor histidine kinase [Alicyclobacillus fastidiosus]|uniref:histidine kinase n=1 Tax=Alicyclobacillus fastidiosus TaxID=392011 RepID=A0ABV5AIZ4_9BACL|nr:sensor histidine kinase [Alicyclobacillus fastidiosus]WEH09232.1 sensor histidine kinase [Alicyclobacillus fastidiosus]